MNPINDYFDKVIWINADARADRHGRMWGQLALLGIEAVRFRAHWKPIDHNGRQSSNMGCTASHRGVLELICHNGWDRTLVLEDDNVFLENFMSRFEEFVRQVPDKWDFLFLGGSYAENPKGRLTQNVVHTNGLMTTSSYGISLEMARKMAPHISGCVGIDTLYHDFQRKGTCLMFTPRLCVQGAGYSDIQDREADHSMSMLDERHECMLLNGQWVEAGRVFTGPMMRRELAAPRDMYGEIVIVDGKEYIIEKMDLPSHPASWFRGEAVTYYLRQV